MPVSAAEAAGRSRWYLVLAGTGLLLLLVSLPPLAGEGLRGLLMHGFSFVCHQLPDRSPHLGGVALAVCHRCYGVYWGLLLGALGYPFLRQAAAFRSRYAHLLLPAALLPPGVDWLAGLLGLWVNTPLSRILTGSIFGLAAGYFLARAVVESSAEGETAPRPRAAIGER